MGEKTEHDPSWIDKIPLYVLEDILRKKFEKMSLQELEALAKEGEKNTEKA